MPVYWWRRLLSWPRNWTRYTIVSYHGVIPSVIAISLSANHTRNDVKPVFVEFTFVPDGFFKMCLAGEYLNEPPI